MPSFDDAELSRLRSACFRGIARIELDALNFRHPLVQRKHRPISQKNVRRLQGIFKKVGCKKLQEDNFINAVIDDASLDDALALSAISRDRLLDLREGQDLPLLSLQVDCLSGLHRVEAAKNFLDDNDRWWVVRLFTKDAPKDVLSRIIEYYSNEQRPGDGEIFRKIHFYRQENDVLMEDQWWAYLEKAKSKNLRQLLKNRSLASAFNMLVDMPGLWTTFHLGALHRLLALKCDEEMIRYLRHIKRTWDTILKCGDTTLPYSVVDSITAEKLQSLCPAYSTSDSEYVVHMMETRIIFPSVTDEGLRSALLANITSFSSLIPTLWTFFETLKYLEPMCDILKRLIGEKMKQSIRKSLLGCFFAPEKVRVQKSDAHEVEFKGQLDSDKVAQLAYIQLWAYCSRHFDGLVAFTPRKEQGKVKPMIKEPNPVLWQRLAQFALKIGFRTPVAGELAAQDSLSTLAIDYLKKANPLSASFSAAQIQSVVLASSHWTIPVDEAQECDSAQLEIERRCGRPFESDLGVDKRFLFIPNIYGDQHCTAVNLRFARRDLFKCIFGPFHFQDDDFSPPVLSHRALDNCLPMGPETRKRAETSNHAEEYSQKKRRLEEIDQNQKFASLAAENKRLRADRAALKNRFDAAQHQISQLNHRIDAFEENRNTGMTEHQEDPSTRQRSAPMQASEGEGRIRQNDSFSLDTLFSEISPQENFIEELLASHKHTYSQESPLGHYEIFFVTNISNTDIEGLSFLFTTSNADRQVQILMDLIDVWWAKTMPEPGPFVVSARGKVVPNRPEIPVACVQHGTCFVATRNDVDKIINLINKNES